MPELKLELSSTQLGSLWLLALLVGTKMMDYLVFIVNYLKLDNKINYIINIKEIINKTESRELFMIAMHIIIIIFNQD